MKLQIKSHAVRFRITSQELQEFIKHGHLASETRVPQTVGEFMVFQYAVRYSAEALASELELSPFAVNLVLNEADFMHLADPVNDGVYIRREYPGDDGKLVRFVVYVEVDMVGKSVNTSVPETWPGIIADINTDDNSFKQPEASTL